MATVTNYWVNPSFEIDVTGVVASTGTGFFKDSGAALIGASSLVYQTSTVGYTMSLGGTGAQCVPVTVGSQAAFRFSWQQYVTPGTWDIVCAVLASNGSTILETITLASAQTPPATWAERTFIATVTASGAAYARLAFRCVTAGGFRLDKVLASLAPAGVVPSYFDGSTSGASWTGTAGKSSSTITDTAPVVSAGASAGVVQGATWTRSGSFADADSTSWTATVDYGDGGGAAPLTLNGDKTFTLSHVYTTLGSATATVTVIDNLGLAGTATVAVTVTEAPITGRFLVLGVAGTDASAPVITL